MIYVHRKCKQFLNKFSNFFYSIIITEHFDPNQ